MPHTQILLSVVPNSETKWLLALHSQRMLIRRNGKPTSISAIAIVLRFDVFGHQLPNRQRVATDVLTGLAVRIVLLRTSSVPIHLLKVNRQSQAHTKLRHQRHIVSRRFVVGIHFHLPLSIDSVSQRVVGTNRQFHFSLHNDNAFPLHTHFLQFTLLCCIAPRTKSLGKAIRTLVVVDRFPKIGFKGCFQHLFTIDHPFCQCTAIVNQNLSTPGSHPNAVGSFLHLRYPFGWCQLSLSEGTTPVELLMCHCKTCICPKRLLFQTSIDI